MVGQFAITRKLAAERAGLRRESLTFVQGLGFTGPTVFHKFISLNDLC
jgi:hypothetical protein